MSVQKILVIEDTKTVAEYLAQLLRAENYVVEMAFSGNQAFELLDNEDFNLVYLDLILPDVSGEEILKHIRKTKTPELLPVIILSGIKEENKIVELLQKGANDFLTKPFSELILKIKTKKLLLLEQKTRELKKAINHYKAQSKQLTDLVAHQATINHNLIESEERFKKLANLAFEGILIHNKGIAIDVNEAFTKIFGYERDELINKNIIQLLILPEYIEVVVENFKNDIAKPYEVLAQKKNGDVFSIEIEAKNIIYNDENIRIGSIRDISERILAEKIIKQQNEELKLLNTDKDRFISILSHDLRSPFNTLLGFSGLLLKNIHKYERHKIEKQLTIIFKTAQQTFSLLDDLLLWSKSQAGKLPFEPKYIAFNEVCNEIISSVELTAQLKKIKIEFMESEPFFLSADSNMLKTILRNLISNAIKFSFEESEIVIYAVRKAASALITVSDSGVGIDKENQNKLWQLSNNLIKDGTAGEKGTGLGLHLCKDFVEKHGGQIWVESEPGKGSDFMFTIPLAKD
jgi:PAS domain S-box-containing protein